MQPRIKIQNGLLLSLENDTTYLLNHTNGERVRLGCDLVILLSYLHSWRTLQDITNKFLNIPSSTLEKLLQRLIESGVVIEEGTKVNSEGKCAYASNVEMFIHRNAAKGHFDQDYIVSRGIPPPPAFKSVSIPSMDSAIVDLNLVTRERKYSNFEEVLMGRTSCRRFSSKALSLQELSKFLDLSAKVKAVKEVPFLGTISFRPAASGGARHPLEIYIINKNIKGLDSGIFYYHPLKNFLVRLEQTQSQSETCEHFSGWISTALEPGSNSPACILIISACFARTMWKYRNMGLKVIYHDVGCLLQTMYLVATYLGLGGCAIGTGDQSQVENMLALNSNEESLVTCFVLGHK